MVSHAIWFMQCPKSIYEGYESSTQAFHFVVVYFDDILIHNKHEEHMQHLSLVLQALRENKLYLNLKKCEFITNRLLFLGFIISSKGISAYEQKIIAIRELPTPSNV